MDIVEINKLTRENKVIKAKNEIYKKKLVNNEDAVILIAYACKKMYGLNKTVNILHSIGIKDLKL